MDHGPQIGLRVGDLDMGFGEGLLDTGLTVGFLDVGLRVGLEGEVGLSVGFLDVGLRVGIGVGDGVGSGVGLNKKSGCVNNVTRYENGDDTESAASGQSMLHQIYFQNLPLVVAELLQSLVPSAKTLLE